MRRTQLLLSAVAGILVIALFWFLLYQPKREALAEVEEQILAEEAVQAGLQTEINRLRSVRDEAPEVEAELAAAEAIVPRDAALPSALRQLQLAADEAGLVLSSVSTGRPTAVDGAPEGLAGIDVTVQILGGYFQTVDFLRRVEDPAITPRGLVWLDAALAKAEYPQLSVSLSGRIFVVLPAPPPVEEETSETGDEGVEPGEEAPVDEADEGAEDGVDDTEGTTTVEDEL